MTESIVSCPNCGRRNRVAAVGDGIPRCAVCHHALPWTVSVDAGSFDEAVAATVPVVADFWAAWCGPCKWVEPALESLATERAGALKVVKVDVEAAPEIAERYDIRGIPALVLIRDGSEVDRLVGAASKPQLDAWLEGHVGAQAARS
jgi:thioredoxin 2